MSTFRLKVVFTFIVLCVIAGLFPLLDISTEPEKRAIITGLYKEIFTYTIIGVLGAGILDRYQRTKAEQDELFQFTKEIRQKLTDIYLKVKRARWELRANHRGGCIKTNLYHGCIRKLVDLKAEIETLQFNVKHHKRLDSSRRNDIILQLEKMEDYVDNLVDECQKHADFNAHFIEVVKLPNLSAFIRPRNKEQNETKDENPFGRGYRVPLRLTIDLLDAESLKARTQFTFFKLASPLRSTHIATTNSN